MYEIEITVEGLRHLNKLPDKVRHAALESIVGSISDDPNRLGKPLLEEFEGLRSARRGDYRIIYGILQDDEVVLIHRGQHRRARTDRADSANHTRFVRETTRNHAKR